MSKPIESSSINNVSQPQSSVLQTGTNPSETTPSLTNLAGPVIQGVVENQHNLRELPLSLNNRCFPISQNSSPIPSKSILSPLNKSADRPVVLFSLGKWSDKLTDHLLGWKYVPNSEAEKNGRFHSGLRSYTDIFLSSSGTLNGLKTTDLTKDSKIVIFQNIMRVCGLYPNLFNRLEDVCGKLDPLRSALYPKNGKAKPPNLTINDIELHKKTVINLKQVCTTLLATLNQEWVIYEKCTIALQPYLLIPLNYEKMGPQIKIGNFFSGTYFVIQNNESETKKNMEEVSDLYSAYLKILHQHGDYLRVFIRTVRKTSELLDDPSIWLKQQKPKEKPKVTSDSEENDSDWMLSGDDDEEKELTKQEESRPQPISNQNLAQRSKSQPESLDDGDHPD